MLFLLRVSLAYARLHPTENLAKKTSRVSRSRGRLIRKGFRELVNLFCYILHIYKVYKNVTISTKFKIVTFLNTIFLILFYGFTKNLIAFPSICCCIAHSIFSRGISAVISFSTSTFPDAISSSA